MWLLNPYIAFPPSGLALPNIGDPFQGGYYAGLISHTANGNATHALIVAPRATGATGTGYPVTTNLQWKTTDTLTAGTGSLFDGVANTAAIVAAGIADHPAASFCVNLNIAGFNDWYLPARYELDIAYENLKPSLGQFSQNNTTSGINPYSVPPRAANRTSSVPGQTAATLFQLGNTQPFSESFHLSSSEARSDVAWSIDFATGLNTDARFAGRNKVNALRVRAFRRVAL